MTKEEASLLLYLETRAVDHGGLVDVRHMNKFDMAIAERWNEEGFVWFGRLASECVLEYNRVHHDNHVTHWCELSTRAWETAHEERVARYHRINSKRTWYTTAEKRAMEVGSVQEIK